MCRRCLRPTVALQGTFTPPGTGLQSSLTQKRAMREGLRFAVSHCALCTFSKIPHPHTRATVMLTIRSQKSAADTASPSSYGAAPVHAQWGLVFNCPSKCSPSSSKCPDHCRATCTPTHGHTHADSCCHWSHGQHTIDTHGPPHTGTATSAVPSRADASCAMPGRSCRMRRWA